MHGPQQNYIGGTWVAAVVAAPNVNPSNLNDVIADYARAQPAEVWSESDPLQTNPQLLAAR
jgi:aldehyde dehydrogenase (NAD+)